MGGYNNIYNGEPPNKESVPWKVTYEAFSVAHDKLVDKKKGTENEDVQGIYERLGDTLLVLP